MPDIGIPREKPCGECHLKPGETCDICGAKEPERDIAWCIAEIERLRTIVDHYRRAMDAISASGNLR